MMRSCCVCLCLFIIGQAVADNPAQDKEKLEGLWQGVAVERNGRLDPDEQVKQFQIRFKGDKIVFNPEGENREHSFEIDPLAQPKAMDLIPGDGPAKGKRLPFAIYRLDGDKLMICIDKEGETGKRPREFKTTAGDGLGLVTLERVKTAR